MGVSEHPLPTPPSNPPDSFDTRKSELSDSTVPTHPTRLDVIASDVREGDVFERVNTTTTGDSGRRTTQGKAVQNRPSSAASDVSNVKMSNAGEMMNGYRERQHTAENNSSGPTVASHPADSQPMPLGTPPATAENRSGVGTLVAQPKNSDNSESAPLPQQTQQTSSTNTTTTTTITTPPVNTDVEMKDASSSYIQPSKHPHDALSNDEPPTKRFKTEPSHPSTGPEKKLPANQTKFLSALLRHVKKGRDAKPFLEPVDPIKLNIPRYFDIITRPMDLGTMEKKLNQNAYGTPQAFIDDFNLMIDNCVKFNGLENPVTKMAKNIQATFEKGIKSLPPESVLPTCHPHSNL